LDFKQKKDEKRRQERKSREAFQALVKEKYLSREINHKTKWREFVKINKEDERYFNIAG
jgi:hypothetical protein